MTLESDRSGPIDRERSIRNAFFDSACVGHLVLTKAFAVVDANSWFCNWIGRDHASLCAGSDIQSLLTVGGRILFETHVAPMLALNGDVAEAALDFRASSGIRLPALVNIARRPDDGEGYVFVSVSPAANRLAYEQEVIRFPQTRGTGPRRLLDVLESASDLILMADQDLVVTYANQNARRALDLVSAEGVALVDLLAGSADRAVRSSILDAVSSETDAGSSTFTTAPDAGWRSTSSPRTTACRCSCGTLPTARTSRGTVPGPRTRSSMPQPTTFSRA